MGQNQSARRKTCQKVSLCNTNPLHGLVWETTRASEGENPSTNRLSHGMVTMVSIMKHITLFKSSYKLSYLPGEHKENHCVQDRLYRGPGSNLLSPDLET